MEIIFKENYLDEDAENSDDGSREVFTAGKKYPVKERFGKKLVRNNKAELVSDNNDKTFKNNKED